MTWHETVVNRLREHRSNGFEFQVAWQLTMRQYPPKGSMCVVEAVPTLFDEHGDREESQIEFFKRACYSAYDNHVGPVGSGDGPMLRGFRMGMLDGMDMTEPARRSSLAGNGRQRMAA